MFKNILVPTDGSSFSRDAGKYAVALAKATGASITGFHAAPAYKSQVFQDYVPPDFMFRSDYAANAKEVAQRHLDTIRKLAEKAGVKFSGEFAMDDDSAGAIAKAAKKYGCDGIVMGSHGRSGVSRMLLGSQSQKVLASANVPVMVVR